ncbi:MAG: hypothetical protein ABS43_01770 [Bordetella sp. SCN 67-23]|nr:hypothetical protein [Burkholderiales bacterium]ODS76298.1 MAG: hypothetical protein ABS43_01770 [Bordetella sp. SCN 67-23]OJW90101.1 MAG: hypothetical protein BGO71_27705 [Burkholderiales bacterium 67-32]
MSTVTEEIYQACVSRWQALALPGGARVFDRTRVAAFLRDNMPCVRVREGADLRVGPQSDDVDERELTLMAEVFLHGETQDALADPIRQALARALWEEPMLGGLCHWISTADRPAPLSAEADGLQQQIVQHFRVRYLVKDSDLSRPD